MVEPLSSMMVEFVAHVQRQKEEYVAETGVRVRRRRRRRGRRWGRRWGRRADMVEVCGCGEDARERELELWGGLTSEAAAKNKVL